MDITNIKSLNTPPDEDTDTKILNILAGMMASLEEVKEKLELLEQKINDIDTSYGDGFSIDRFDS